MHTLISSAQLIVLYRRRSLNEHKKLEQYEKITRKIHTSDEAREENKRLERRLINNQRAINKWKKSHLI